MALEESTGPPQPNRSIPGGIDSSHRLRTGTCHPTSIAHARHSQLPRLLKPRGPIASVYLAFLTAYSGLNVLEHTGQQLASVSHTLNVAESLVELQGSREALECFIRREWLRVKPLRRRYNQSS